MKNITIFLILLLATGFARAQTGNLGIGTATPGSKLTLNGSFAGPYKIVTTGGPIGANDYYIAYNGASAATLTLPAATVAAPAAGNILGRTYQFKNTSSSVLTIQANGTELIDMQAGAGVDSITLSPGYYAMFISKGTIGAVTTWEVSSISNSQEIIRPAVLIIKKTAATNMTKLASGASTIITDGAIKLNTITGATYNTATGMASIPPGTYFVSMTIDGTYAPTPNDNTTVSGSITTFPLLAFYYDFFNDVSYDRISTNTSTIFGLNSFFGVTIAYVTTFTTTKTFPFSIKWGIHTNVNNGKVFSIGTGTQLSFTKIL